MRPGEILIDCLDSIEDTKGNNGDKGIDFYKSLFLQYEVGQTFGLQERKKEVHWGC